MNLDIRFSFKTGQSAHQNTSKNSERWKHLSKQCANKQKKSTFDFNTNTPIHQNSIQTTNRLNSAMRGNENQQHHPKTYNLNTSMTDKNPPTSDATYISLQKLNERQWTQPPVPRTYKQNSPPQKVCRYHNIFSRILPHSDMECRHPKNPQSTHHQTTKTTSTSNITRKFNHPARSQQTYVKTPAPFESGRYIYANGTDYT